MSEIEAIGNTIKKINLAEKMRLPIIPRSPDGEKLAIGFCIEQKALTDVLTLDMETMETLASGLPSAWSPDGQWLLASGETSMDPPFMTISNRTSGQLLSFPKEEAESGNHDLARSQA